MVRRRCGNATGFERLYDLLRIQLNANDNELCLPLFVGSPHQSIAYLQKISHALDDHTARVVGDREDALYPPDALIKPACYQGESSLDALWV